MLMKQPPAALREEFASRRLSDRLRFLPLMAVVTLFASSMMSVKADTVTWIGAVGDFDDGSNWSGGVEPQPNDDIVIENGGTVQSSYSVDVENVSIGGGSTYAVLPGEDSIFTPDAIYLGTSGTGTLTIGSQAMVSAANNLYLGYGSGSTGVLSMDNAYLSPFSTYIGYVGTGTMTLNNGSTLQSTFGYVGYEAGSKGEVTLTDSTWKAEDGGLPVDITVGVDGEGEVQATNSEINADNLTLGNGVASTGTVSLSGGKLELTSNIVIGNAGTGNFTLSNSATATNQAAVIASLAGSTGSASLTDSTWTLSGDLDVGLGGNGTLNAQNSQIEAPELFVARNADSSGSVTLAGGLTTIQEEIHVGALGSGDFTLQGNAILHSDRGNAGFGAGATGVITVEDSLWTVTQAVFVGVNGHGTVNIDGEGEIQSESAYIGQNAGGNGTVNITSTGSWNMTNTLAVGVYGTGNLVATGGGVHSVWGQVGLQAGSSGTVHLDNANWTSQNSLTIGVQGDGHFTAENGSTISAQTIELAASGGIIGILEVTNSTLETEVIIPGGGTASLSLSGAQINLLGGSSVEDALLISGFASDAVVIGPGGLSIDTQGGNAQITTILSGSGSLTKEGEGRLRLTTANTFAAGSFVNGGALEIANDLALGEGDVALADGELRAFTNTTLSGNVSSGIQLISVSANQTGTFSAVNGQTLTLAPLDFLLVAGSTMRVGSAGNDGTVIFAPTGATALPADVEIFVDNGTLQAGNGGLMFMANIAESVTVAAGATLDFNDQVSGGAVGNLRGGGTVQIGVSPDSVLAVNSGNFSGGIFGTGSLAKQTTGTLILSGNNTIAGGTSITGGTLQVDGFLGNGPVEIQPGGTLSGSGTVVQISLNGGTLSPGSSAGTLTTAELLWYGGVMLFELGPTSDHLVADSLQGFGGAYFFTFENLGWSEGTTYDLITMDGSPIDFDIENVHYTNSGGFSGTFALDNNVLQFTLHTIPEPSTIMFLALAGAITLQSRKRKKTCPA